MGWCFFQCNALWLELKRARIGQKEIALFVCVLQSWPIDNFWMVSLLYKLIEKLKIYESIISQKWHEVLVLVQTPLFWHQLFFPPTRRLPAAVASRLWLWRTSIWKLRWLEAGLVLWVPDIIIIIFFTGRAAPAPLLVFSLLLIHSHSEHWVQVLYKLRQNNYIWYISLEI